MTQIWNTSQQTINSQILNFTIQDDANLDAKIFLPYDLKATKAHAQMLHKIGLLTKSELRQALQGLDELAAQHTANQFHLAPEMEDCHSAIESYLTEKFGEVGKKIHTARSRNDQALTMIRLYMKDQISMASKQTKALIKQWKIFAKKYRNQPMPGYTHMQKAMPTTVGIWQGSYADALQDMLILLQSAEQICDQSPLGSAAGFGIPFDIDRQFTAQNLQFKKVQENPIYCQLSRGQFEQILLFALQQIATIISKWANDLMLFTMSEFQFFQLPTQFCTSSSIMPQKKNYDVLELLRANSAVIESAQLEIGRIHSSLHSGYHRDLQLTKSPLVRACGKFHLAIATALTVAQSLQINQNALEKAMTPDLFATAKVYQLVRQGHSFREAYGKIKQELNPTTT